MSITISMLDYMKCPALFHSLVAKYMEYPPKGKVAQAVIHRHEIGEAQHFDFRFRVNDYLVGWSIVGFSREKPATIEHLLKNIGKGFRAEEKCISEYCNEWKYIIKEIDGKFYAYPLKWHELVEEELARQPLGWLRVKGVIEPGEPGAGIEKPGRFTILSKPKVVFGAQKPYFHEYFLKDKHFKDWTRIVLTAVKVPRIDPKTKKPIPGKYEVMWRFMIPKVQKPYAISKRAIVEEQWKPPKGIVPFPEDWVKKEFPKDYERWKEFMAQKLSGKIINYSLLLHAYRGPIHIRGMWVLDWYLLLDIKGKGKVKVYKIKKDPLRESPVLATDWDSVHRKYMDYEGFTKPMSFFNPNKELVGRLSVLTKGKVEYSTEYEPGGELIINLNFKTGDLRGKWKMIQVDPGSEQFTFEKELSLEKYEFVYHKHYGDVKPHYDIRINLGPKLLEFNLKEDIRTKGIVEPVESIRKYCYDVKAWFVTKGKAVKRKIGRLNTLIDVIDYGKVTIIEDNPQFISMSFEGKQLSGIYIARRVNRHWLFMKTKLPKALEEGNPREGKYFDPFIIEHKRGWKFFRVHIYDIRDFTRCEGVEKAKQYFPDLRIPESVKLGVCLYPVPGKIHHVRVAYIDFDVDKWKYEEAEQWIRKNKLHTFGTAMIREKKK